MLILPWYQMIYLFILPLNFSNILFLSDINTLILKQDNGSILLTVPSPFRRHELQTESMIRYPILVFSILFLSTAQGVYAQSGDAQITEAFFRQYALDPMKAFDYAFSTNKWMDRNQDAVENLKNQYNQLLPLIGTYYGYDLISEKSMGDHLKVSSFMLRYDRQPMRLTFVFYKPKDQWQVQNLKYDDKLPEELEEAAKKNN